MVLFTVLYYKLSKVCALENLVEWRKKVNQSNEAVDMHFEFANLLSGLTFKYNKECWVSPY